MINFQDLSKVEFAWPRKEDIPIAPPSDPSAETRVFQDSDDHRGSMMTGYKECADLLVAKVLENRDLRTLFIYPIVLNYRQFIERSVKYLIYTFGHAVGIQPDWKGSDIAVLWTKFLRIQAVYGVDHFNKTNLIMAKVIVPFAQIDPASFAYRYPVDMTGKLIPVGADQLDLATLVKVMEGVEAYFSSCDEYLTRLQAAAP